MKKSGLNLKAFSLIEISMVILIIGILIAGVATANSLIAKSRISSAQTLTISSPINSIKDTALWLESSTDTSFVASETYLIITRFQPGMTIAATHLQKFL